MPSQAPERPKVFTPTQANATLPLVRAIVSDLVDLARDIQERRQRLAVLTAGRDDGRRGAKRRDFYGEELEHVEEEMENDIERLREYAAELQALGVELKDPMTGLVDFPAMRDGRLVYLCWKHGEPEIGFWHELDAGFSGRQELIDTALGEAALGDAEMN